LFAKNVYRAIVPSTSERNTALIAKCSTPFIAAIAVYLTINGGNSIVALLIMGYSIVTQLFPALVASLIPNSMINRAGAAAGILAGVITVAIVVTFKLNLAVIFPWAPPSIKDINAGFIALGLNLVVMFSVSALTRRQPVAAPAE
jgi:SSS family solute:Na+ symporter